VTYVTANPKVENMAAFLIFVVSMMDAGLMTETEIGAAR